MWFLVFLGTYDNFLSIIGSQTYQEMKSSSEVFLSGLDEKPGETLNRVGIVERCYEPSTFASEKIKVDRTC